MTGTAPSRAGLTLVEVLAVLAILTLVAGLGGTTLLAHLEAPVLDRAEAALASQLAAVQRAARRDGGLTVALTRDGLAWRTDGDDRTAIAFPLEARTRWRAVTEVEDLAPAAERWSLDARGRGVDLAVELEAEEGVRCYRVAGLTGLLLAEPDP